MTSRAGRLASLIALAAIGCDAPAAVRGVDDAGVAAEALRVEAHLPPAFRDPPARFAARPTEGGWRFARAGLEATFAVGSGGLQLRAGAVETRVELVEVARGSARVELGEPRVMVDGARVRVLRGAHVEELFVHGEPGIEHVVSLERVPGGGGPLELVIGIAGGAQVEVGARGARVIDAGRNVALVYEGVRAWDARGVELAAWMEADARGVRLVIDDAGASPPILVDPLIAVPRTVLSASDRASGDALGHSLDFEGDVAVAGAPDRAGGGAAYVFERTASGWVERATLVPPGALDGDDAGWSVAISGDTIVVGSPGDNHPTFAAAGAVDVFRRVAAGWTHEARIVNPEPTVGSERFGVSVAIAGDLMVVGAVGDRTAGLTGAGGAYVYRRTGTSWALEDALTWARASNNDSFGASVATDGTRIAVGAPYENGLLLDGDGFIVNEDVGAVFVFERSGGAWVEQARLAAATERSYEYVGGALAIDGDRILAGAIGADDDEGFIRRRGAGYVFAWTGTAWAQEARLVPASTSDWEQLGALGSSVALQGSLASVGAPNAMTYGAVLAFQRSASTWSQVARVVGTGTTRELGSASALEGTTWIAGATGEDFAGGTDQGALHVYEIVESGAQGQACLAPGDCASGFCVDGVCCEAACAGGPGDCRACSVAAGAAVDGACGPVVAGTICRAPVAACDAAESCDGVATTCPADARAPAGTVCRAAASPCDAEETCSGTAITCPFDDVVADGEACDDGMVCNGADACTSGVCGPSGAALECDDGDACTADSCAEPAGCAHAPIAGCCTSDAACDDGDPCTTDACMASSCAHELIAGCGEDAGTGEVDAGRADAGPPDAGAADAGGGEPSSDGGCGCAAPGRTGGSPVWALLGLVASALVARGRRRCRS